MTSSTVDPAGLLSVTPTVTTDAGNVPFAFTFTHSGQLVSSEAAHSTLHTYALGSGGSLTSLSASVSDGQSAGCWVSAAGAYYFVANAGSNDISAYTVASDGTPSLVGTTSIVGTTDAGPIDLAASADGNTLYVEAGAPAQSASSTSMLTDHSANSGMSTVSAPRAVHGWG